MQVENGEIPERVHRGRKDAGRERVQSRGEKHSRRLKPQRKRSDCRFCSIYLDLVLEHVVVYSFFF